MKKLLALVLALIMVLGLGVTAFAAGGYEPKMNLKVIYLGEEDDDDDEDPEYIFDMRSFYEDDDENPVFLAAPEGDDYYFEFKDYDLYKNITITATGNITAEIVDFDSDTMRYPSTDNRYRVVYRLIDGAKADPAKGIVNYNDANYEGHETTPFDYMQNARIDVALAGLGYEDPDEIAKFHTEADKLDAEAREKAAEEDQVLTAGDSFEYAEYFMKKLNKKAKYERFTVGAFAYVGAGSLKRLLNDKLIKITTADNYSAAYKEGKVKITATRKADKETCVAEFTVVSDVVIFEYEEVKWAAKKSGALTIKEDLGYSDYITAQLGYADNDDEYDPDFMRMCPDATVVSTTAFRAIEGEELNLESQENVGTDPFFTVTIDEVAKGQKGVNFDYDYLKYYDEDDEKLEGTTFKALKGDVDHFEFGFLGDQVIASDFEITVNLPYDYFELRELFGKKVEEEDIITYYVLKDGIKIDEFTIDYKDDEIDEDVELEIIGKAGEKLGYYTITLDAPAAEEGGEENPNTGAESVVGVVAAMAVISLVSAAAVSLKK